MSSIFTYDPDPPRVSSPWLTPTDSPVSSTPNLRSFSSFRRGLPLPSPPEFLSKRTSKTPPPSLLSDYNVTKLEPEPQTGPAEYKLHLLLRPRRSYSSTSTGGTPSAPKGSTPACVSEKTRQYRLLQLTTQLLWRLQQSSPYHASSKSDLVLPQLPEAAARLESPTRPGKLLTGLEGSRGALYEIGVSDDGNLVGLTEDEMEESLNNLRAMAFSLGCNVQVTRMVAVGECEWYQDCLDTDAADYGGSPVPRETSLSVTKSSAIRQHESLWVAEALVTPNLGSKDEPQGPSFHPEAPQNLNDYRAQDSTEQLRVTLTGPTTSGKSSLLGTLSTATLDNGRGKSRLSLLKHRHELASGMTSSVAHELLGYNLITRSPRVVGEVINYATGNVSSWTDIHAAAENGRLVFVSDSAGHPRYRRTTVRGLIGWAPHWTLLCVAADDVEATEAGRTSSAQEIFGSAGAGVDLRSAHLELCLKLDKPLAIIITKLDLASKTSLRQTLNQILTAVKSTGRQPVVLPPEQVKGGEIDLSIIPDSDTVSVEKALSNIQLDNLSYVVPIIMTSSAKGSGIRGLHALLSQLPIPPPPQSSDYVGEALNPEQPSSLFHVEDTFDLPATYSISATDNSDNAGTVVAGYLRFGTLSIGDSIVVGPFPEDPTINVDELETRRTKSSVDVALSYPSTRPSEGTSLEKFSKSFSHPSASELTRVAAHSASFGGDSAAEWHSARVVSIRNLRLPVNRLFAGQVGTIGIVFEPRSTTILATGLRDAQAPLPRIRKGMVLAIPSHHMEDSGPALQAASGFTASFEDEDVNSVPIGTLVIVYIASIRASARVIRLEPHVPLASANTEASESDDLFGLDDEIYNADENNSPIFGSDGTTDVTLELLTSREWIELGSQVMIMSGGSQSLYYGSEKNERGIAGLDGFVGKVIEVVE